MPSNDVLFEALRSSSGVLLAVKSALLIAAAMIIERALRSRSAALRHGLWTALFIALLLLPAVSSVAPPWNVPLVAVAVPEGSSRSPSAISALDADSVGAGDARALRDGLAGPQPTAETGAAGAAKFDAAALDPWSLIGAAWAIGTLLLLARLALSVGVASVICRRARTVDDARWRRDADRAMRRVGFRGELRLARSETASMPMTWGLRRHTVLLPAAADAWSAQRREVVLLHEIAHAARADCAAQLISSAAAALHWFNPLVWVARRRQVAERELACDDAVLRAGASPADYARHLLEIARAAAPGPRLAPAGVMMARRSQLEGRLLAALEPHRDRRRLTTPASVGVLVAVLLIAIPLGTLTPWDAATADASPQGPATESLPEGTRTQPEGGGIAEQGVPEQESGGRARVVATMIGILAGDDSAGMRTEAAQTLGQMEDAAAVEGLARAVVEDESAAVRSKAAWALGMIESPDAVPALSRALQDERTSVRSEAAWALGMIESPDAVSVLVAALADDSESVVAQAAWALGMIESPDAVEGLTRVLQAHAAQAVRSQAAWALGMIEDERGLEALIDALEDDHDSVRQQALWAIGMIVG